MSMDEFYAEMSRRFDGMAELIAQMNERIDQRFGELDRRIDQRFRGLERRLDRVEERLGSVEFQLVGLNRSEVGRERSISEMAATQTAQQRVIDDLASRVTRLEQRQ